jgi:hypothetical protein
MKGRVSLCSVVLLIRDMLMISPDLHKTHVFSSIICNLTAQTNPAITEGRSVGCTPIPD